MKYTKTAYRRCQIQLDHLPVDEPPEWDLADRVPGLVGVDVVAEPGHLQLPDHFRRVLAVGVDRRDELERDVVRDRDALDQTIAYDGLDGSNGACTARRSH